MSNVGLSCCVCDLCCSQAGQDVHGALKHKWSHVRADACLLARDPAGGLIYLNRILHWSTASQRVLS